MTISNHLEIYDTQNITAIQEHLDARRHRVHAGSDRLERDLVGNRGRHPSAKVMGKLNISKRMYAVYGRHHHKAVLGERRMSMCERCIREETTPAGVLTATLPTLTSDAVPPRVVICWTVMIVKSLGVISLRREWWL